MVLNVCYMYTVLKCNIKVQIYICIFQKGQGFHKVYIVYIVNKRKTDGLFRFLYCNKVQYNIAFL